MCRASTSRDWLRSRKSAVCCCLEHPIGDFVIDRAPLLRADRALGETDERELRTLLSIDAQRGGAQDVAFGIQQIVDIALKGLSPGINDTTTALMCIDHLSAVLRRIATRRMLPRLDGPELARVIVRGAPSFDVMLATAFDSIRRNASGNPDVLLGLIFAADTLLSTTAHPARRQLIAEHVRATLECAQRTVAAQREREAVADAGMHTLSGLEPALAPLAGTRHTRS